jgi:hypothetical protein
MLLAQLSEWTRRFVLRFTLRVGDLVARLKVFISLVVVPVILPSPPWLAGPTLMEIQHVAIRAAPARAVGVFVGWVVRPACGKPRRIRWEPQQAKRVEPVDGVVTDVSEEIRVLSIQDSYRVAGSEDTCCRVVVPEVVVMPPTLRIPPLPWELPEDVISSA